MTTLPNGDMKLLCQKLDSIALVVTELKDEQKKFHAETQRSMAQRQIQVALLEQANIQICKDIEARKEECETLEARFDRQDTYNKIIGGMTAALYAIAGIFGINQS